MDIEIKKIRRDGGTQSRANINNDVVAEYSERMREGVAFPPVTLFYDGKAYWLADGFHRVAAAEAAGLGSIAADVRQGTQRDAVLHSVGVNAAHGLRRTNDDKRRAVEVLLRDKEWRLWSDREIARQAGVDHKTVGKLRSELVQSGEIPHTIAPAALMKLERIVQDSASYTFSSKISDDPDCEAARQIAIKALETYPVAAFNARLENGEDGTIEGVPYRIGEGKLIDAAGGAHDVGAAHIAVALITNNGGLVYRFDARQLLDWMNERQKLAISPEMINALYRLLGGALYVGYDILEKATTFGFVAKVGNKTCLSVYGRAVIDSYMDRKPSLKVEHRIRTEDGLGGGLGDGLKELDALYNAQRKSKQWVGIVPDWQNVEMLKWAKSFSERGYVAVQKRRALGAFVNGGEKEMMFCVVSENGAELLGKPALEVPSSPPDSAYHAGAKIFIDPSAQFVVNVGDMVNFEGKVGRVVSLRNWPEIRVKRLGESWESTWYENQIEVVEDDGIDLEKQAKLDQQTSRVWLKANELLKAIGEWESDEDDQPQGMNANLGALESLASLMHWVADTYSGQRLKLELPAVLEEVGT